MYASATFVGYSYDVKIKAVFNAYRKKKKLDDKLVSKDADLLKT